MTSRSLCWRLKQRQASQDESAFDADGLEGELTGGETWHGSLRTDAVITDLLVFPETGVNAMPRTQEPTANRQTLNLRIKPEERDLIDRAARARGKNRTEFILDASRRAAEEALLDQVLLSVGEDAFNAFQARLDAPPEPNGRLLETMRTVPPWEQA